MGNRRNKNIKQNHMKTAEEILDELLEKYVLTDPEGVGTDCFFWDDVKTIAKEYASQKQSEITDADIEAWAREESLSSGYIDIKLIRYYGMIRGAKAMRDGEIKHNKTI